MMVNTHEARALVQVKAKGPQAIAEQGQRHHHHVHCCHPVREERTVVLQVVQLALVALNN